MYRSGLNRSGSANLFSSWWRPQVSVKKGSFRFTVTRGRETSDYYSLAMTVVPFGKLVQATATKRVQP
jgi:hypothetical protein